MPHKSTISGFRHSCYKVYRCPSRCAKLNPKSKLLQTALDTYLQALHRRKALKHTILISVLLYYYLKNVMRFNVYKYTLEYEYS